MRSETHATANALIAVDVLVFNQWQLWQRRNDGHGATIGTEVPVLYPRVIS